MFYFLAVENKLDFYFKDLIFFVVDDKYNMDGNLNN